MNAETYRCTASELRSFIDRLERLDADAKDISEARKDVMSEVKGRGYDPKAIRKLIAIRKRDAADVAEEDAVVEMYKQALSAGSE